MRDLINELKNSQIPSKSEDYILMNSKYVPIAISKNNFHKISSLDTKNLKLMFVDGGNSVIFESSDFCLGFIRLSTITYQNNVRIARKADEFYVLIKEENNNYVIKTFPQNKFNNMKINSKDESLQSGLEKFSTSRMLSVIRRFSELNFAKKHSDDTDVVILDGTLESRYPFEADFLKELLDTKKVISLSKTCSLTTKSGESVTKRLYDLSTSSELKNDAWYYFPIVQNKNPLHNADTYFVKLHSKSNHVFRFEIQQNFGLDFEIVLQTLKKNSSDPVFLGYPYGLIDVDQAARVTDEETSMLQTFVSTKMGKDWNDFSKKLNSLNAHSILDNIKF